MLLSSYCVHWTIFFLKIFSPYNSIRLVYRLYTWVPWSVYHIESTGMQVWCNIMNVDIFRCDKRKNANHTFQAKEKNAYSLHSKKNFLCNAKNQYLINWRSSMEWLACLLGCLCRLHVETCSVHISTTKAI